MLATFRLTMAAALGGMLAVQLAATALAADKVKIGTGGSASDAPFYIAQSKCFFKGLEVDLIVLDSGAEVIALLGTDELDVGRAYFSRSHSNRFVAESAST